MPEESILTSVKKMLGIMDDYEHFDVDIIIHINSVFSILTQLGVGCREGFSISDRSAIWTDFIEQGSLLELVKTYVYLRVRQLFDPPASSAVAEAMNRNIAELEWRISVAADTSHRDRKEENQNE